MGETTIAWTDYTLNFWRGCTKVGPGCDACYAEARDRRYEGGLHWGAGAPRILASEAVRNAPFKWAKKIVSTGKRKVFAASLADVFDNEVDPAWRVALWDTIRRTPQLRYQLVTKRIGNVAKMLPPGFPRGYEHIGIIATVVNQEEYDRDAPKLLALKAEHNVTWVGLSIEPQIGPINLLSKPNDTKAYLDWIISGGESAQPGHEPRPYDLAWARSLRDQCAAAGVAYFQKQLGARPTDSARLIDFPEQPETADASDVVDMEISFCQVRLKDRQAGADPSEWPADLRVQQFPEALR